MKSQDLKFSNDQLVIVQLFQALHLQHSLNSSLAIAKGSFQETFTLKIQMADLFIIPLANTQYDFL